MILFLNKLFRRPGVGGRESAQAYSEWEYEWGRHVVGEHLEPAGDLRGKRVLDIGCGLGGKTVAYEEAGAAEVVGADLLEANAVASLRFAAQKTTGFAGGFLVGDASRLPMADRTFDTVVANDAMEHFSEPEAAVAEMARVTRPGGAIWLFFTPHFSPLGSHLYDYIYIPWCHLLFSRGTLASAIRKVLAQRDPQADPAQIEQRLEEIMTSYDRDLNHMSVRWFERIIAARPELRVAQRELRPAKFGFFKPLTKVPMVRELFTGFVVCRLERVQ